MVQLLLCKCNFDIQGKIVWYKDEGHRSVHIRLISAWTRLSSNLEVARYLFSALLKFSIFHACHLRCFVRPLLAVYIHT